MSEFDATVAGYVQSFLFYFIAIILLIFLLKISGVVRSLKKRFQSWFLQKMSPKSNAKPETIAAKTKLFNTLKESDQPLDLLEVGAGDCHNFKYYAEGTRVTIVEPNENFWPAIKRRAVEMGAHCHLKTICADVAENLSHIEDESMDAYVMTHVTCSVTDVERTLAEAYRVLKKGGRLYIFHHYSGKYAQMPGLRLLLERWIVTPLFVGGLLDCHPHRSIEDDIRRHFPNTQAEAFEVPFPLLIMRPHLSTVSVKE